MPTPSRRQLVAITLLATAAVAVLTLGATSSATACSSCHAMRPFASALDGSPHADVGCYACHLDSGGWDLPRFKSLELAVMYPAALRGADAPGGPGVHVTSERCLACHPEVLERVVERAGMRIFHETCAEPGGTCDACHTASIHGAASRWPREYEMERCVRCHDTAGAPRECDSCHRDKLERERLTQSAWRVTHGPDWEVAHGAGDLAYCVTCHPGGYCVRCHGTEIPHPSGFGQSHGREHAASDGACETCHSDVRFCDGCHGHRMPHPATFLREHPKVADDRADPTCLRCHDAQDCDECHTRHAHPGRTDGTLGGG